MKTEQYTNYFFWKNMTLSEKGRKNFPLVYYKMTGLEIAPGWKDPPGIVSPSRTQLIWLKRFNFKSDVQLDYKWKSTDVVIPLLHKRGRVGGFLAAYRRLNDIRWVKYTYQPEVGPETPAIAYSGQSGTTPKCLIVDTLPNYLKLINWYHCQKKYTFRQKRYLVVYLDSDKEAAVSLIKRCQLHFNNLIDFTDCGLLNRVKKEYSVLDSAWNSKYTTDITYFDTNPLSIANSKELLERAIRYTGQKL